jgi:acetylornithine deacetylase
VAHELRGEAVAILGELIAFPSISQGTNQALIDYLRERLERLGARIRLSRDATGGKANLFATFGPDGDGGIVLSGHSDVVPVEGQRWSGDPFVAAERDGRLYGRGACDMKGFIACAVALAPRFAASALARPLHLAFTYDEEVGCLGAQVLLDALAKSGVKPAICIVGEPTEMRIIEGHKGCCEYTTTFRGSEGHASQPDKGVNAIEHAARYIGRLLEIGEALKARCPENSRFDPPWSTVQVGRISGGAARNIIAGSCALEWELRPVNAADFDYAKAQIARYVDTELLPRMRASSATAAIVTETVGEVAGLEPMPHSEAEALVRTLTGDRMPASCVSFGTEAGLFQQRGISTVICGPGSIEQAHKPDEYIELAQLDACLAMLGNLQAQLAAPA